MLKTILLTGAGCIVFVMLVITLFGIAMYRSHCCDKKGLVDSDGYDVLNN